MKNKEIKEISFRIVAIGASLGGLDAISRLLKNVPSNSGMAFIVVQHLNPNHKSILTSILSKTTKMKVQEIENMEHMEPNNVYVIPNDKIIEVIDGHIRLLPRLINSSITSIDVLFSSLAMTHKNEVIGIVLSGNAKDGTNGLKAIKKAGGITFAQDESAQAFSMPNSAIESGFVDYIMSPDKIGEEITYLSQNNFINRIELENNNIKISDFNQNDLNAIFELLLNKTGVDFTHYKLPTIKRRIIHKIKQTNIKNLHEYLLFLQKNKNDIDELYNELLINVTSFFRDTETFDFLKSKLFAKILKNKSPEDSFRVWVPACSSGEEAYSLAMIIADLQTKNKNKIPVQIFATDLSENVIKSARIGEYSFLDVKDIPTKYLTRFFEKRGDKYFIIKELREMCVFAPHNILRDPPFSRMDFVSCCNLLIYFDSFAQKKVFTTFHFALNDSGYLMLGKAETIGTSSSYFERINDNFKIYSRKKNTGSRKNLELTPRFPRLSILNKKINPIIKNISSNPIGIESAIDSILLSNYMPACAVINKELEILQFRGPISMFLGHSSGKASLNILKMAHPEFVFELRKAINKAIDSKETITKTDVEIKIDSISRLMTFEVSSLKFEWDEPLMLIVFKLQEKLESSNSLFQKGNELEIYENRIKKLTEELNNTIFEMNLIIENQDFTFNELQEANEEIVSSNEELQTLNEELETSKEEIEATNEELISSNQELQVRNDLLTESYEYSEALYATIHEPILILDKYFHIKSANSSFYKKFQLKKEEIEGKLLFVIGNKEWNISSLKEILTAINIQNKIFENFEITQTFFGIGEIKMLLNVRIIEQKINSEKLILLAIEDITEQSRVYINENLAFKKAEEKFRGYIESAPDALIISDREGKIQLINSQTEKLFGFNREEIMGHNIELLIPSEFREFKNKVEDDLLREKRFIKKSKKIELFGINKEGLEFPIEVSLSLIKADEGILISAAIRDITEQKRISSELSEAKLKAEKATETAEEALMSKEQFLSNMSHEIRTPMNAIIGFTKVIMKSNLTAKQSEYISAIKQSGNALIVLIDDILDLAKVNAGKMTFEQKPFILRSSISSMLDLFEMKIKEKNLLLELKYDKNLPEFIIGDSARLNQIILNLISNAVKFTSKGKIILEINLLNEVDEYVNIEFNVIDTGIGIPANKLNSIFENFQQAYSSTSRFYGGTGLGLAIVKKMVEAQNGQIKVKSEVDKGSTFCFVLKFQKTIFQNEVGDDKVILDSNLKDVRVLVVEDIALNQLLMKTILDDFDFECDIVENGKIAINKIQETKYDIVLMDLQMPEMNGFEATKYIRETLKLDLPIIALTADVTTVDLEKCKRFGMNDYVAKPVDEKLLYGKIVSLLKTQTLVETKTNENAHKLCSNNITDLNYLISRTKSNNVLMAEMISLFLEQTPILIESMKKNIEMNNWIGLKASIHKIIPSIAIIGLNPIYLELAKNIELFADSKTNISEIKVNELEIVCNKVYKELKLKLKDFKG